MKKDGFIDHFLLKLPSFNENDTFNMEFEDDNFYIYPSVVELDVINVVHRLVNPVPVDRYTNLYINNKSKLFFLIL